MHEEAQKRGITCTIFGDNETIQMEKDGHQWYTRGSRTSFQSSIGKSIADNKELTKIFLTHFNLPTAKAVRVESAAELEKLATLQFPLVLKPIDGRHGEGVVVGIENMAEAASEYESSKSDVVLFEEMLKGTEYRVVCVNFKVVAAAFRKPAHVVGDGRSTIAELVAEKNKHPWRGKGHQFNLTTIDINDIVIKNLNALQMTPESVPAQDQEVLLRKTANLSTGGEAWDVTDDICPENHLLFEQIARACNLNIVGIDMMCQSLSQPIIQQPQAGVIEVNASPGLRMHHFPMRGKMRNVAGEILTMTETVLTSLASTH